MRSFCWGGHWGYGKSGCTNEWGEGGCQSSLCAGTATCAENRQREERRYESNGHNRILIEKQYRLDEVILLCRNGINLNAGIFKDQFRCAQIQSLIQFKKLHHTFGCLVL